MKKERKSRKKITRQFLALVMVIILVCTTVDVPLMAADAQGNIQTEMGMDFIITGTDLVYGVDYTYPANTGILTILSDKKITIENAKKDIATTDSIEVADGVNANITLAGVNIDVSTISDKVAFKIADDSTGNVTITLADGETNTLKSGLCCAGLQKKGPYISDTQGKLIIQGGVSGTGTLNAIAGSQAAGIGGREGSNIEIKGGKITAIGGEGGAGIGGCYGAGSAITISGGEIIAIGGKYGAGIGGGYLGEGFDIEIKGGMVTATGGENGAGIGGGNARAGFGIKISEGEVVATGGAYGAGIGGGYGRPGSDITISGGKVIVKGGSDAAGIGSGYNATGCGIKINGGEIDATGGAYGAGIGGGRYGAGSDIKISEGKVIAKGGSGGAGIGGGIAGKGYDIKIGGGVVSAIGSNGAGIGGGMGGEGYDIEISGGSVKVTDGYGGNAIGGGEDKEVAIPTDGNGNNVYLLEVENSLGVDITIDGIDYVDAHDTEKKIYTYLTGISGKVHSVKVGNIITNYSFDEVNSNFTALEPVNIGTNFIITGTDLVYGTDYTYPADTGILTILSEKEITIANCDPNIETTDRIIVKENVNANIILAGVNIHVPETENMAAFKIEYGAGNVTITLADDTINYLYGNGESAGLERDADSENAQQGKIIIQGDTNGTGRLNATGGENGAGIGGSKQKAGGNITINGGIVSATGGENGAGIGGGYQGTGYDIIINGGVISATGSNGDAIGGGTEGSASNIVITGGSVKVTTGDTIHAIGGEGAVIPTDGNGNNVYLLEIENDKKTDIKINDVDYPDTHKDETKIYAYLPAKSATNPNKVVVGEQQTKQCYDTEKSVWMTIVDVPQTDDVTYIYSGEVLKYGIESNDDYTVEGGEQTNAGTYTVTVTLNENRIWSDGTSEAKSYEFKIDKITLKVIDVPTISGIYGQSLSEMTLSKTEGVSDKGITGTWSITQADKENIYPTVGTDATYEVTFTPTDNANYSTVTKTTTVTVSKATPYIVENPTANEITRGETLSNSSLTGGKVQCSKTNKKVVEGTFTWLDANVTPTVDDSNVREYEVLFTPSDTENYDTVITTVTITVNKIENVPNRPQSSMNVSNEYTKIAEVPLPNGWEWKVEDKDKELVVNKTITATAQYTAEDKVDYSKIEITISVTRSECEHTPGAVVWDGTVDTDVAPTCEREGYGHTTCTKCGNVVKSGIHVQGLEHKYKSEITKKATYTEEGIRTYTCTQPGCTKSYTEVIERLKRPSYSGNSGSSNSGNSGSTTNPPTTEEPSTEESSTQEPTTEEPSTEEPSTDESTKDEPTTKEPDSTEENPIDWKQDENGVFYEKEDGTKATGWYEMEDGEWYYFNEEGYRQTGWEKDGDTWYYLNETGVMQTGWQKDNDTWYYLSESGAMQTGWQKDGESWYYLSENGSMQTGWQKDGDNWYYLSESGSMQTGWQKDEDNWYYLSENGSMQTGWLKDGETWYYLNANGSMKTGWLQIGADWFYLNANGSMAADTYIGIWYVDKNGYYIPSKTK